MNHTVFIGLGSNISPKLYHLQEGLRKLIQEKFCLLKVSSVYRTSPIEKTDQPYFLNAVVSAKTTLKALECLKVFKKIEKWLGRTQGERFGPRKLDLDLLLYDRKILKTRELVLPHPRMIFRKFVLIPLLEISPKLSYPSGSSMAVFLSQVRGFQQVKLYRKIWFF